jgi:uncharacterized protein (DUF305 family)
MVAMDGGIPPYTPEDVQFMQGMIHHHAQAIVMSRLAPTRAQREDVKVLAARIAVAQQDEIDFMQLWLRDRKQQTPDPLKGDAAHAGHDMSQSGAALAMHPGMATPAEMAQLERARGAEFDRLFLNLMIRHHQGAIEMVHELQKSPTGGHEPNVFKFVSDVEADQTTEIVRMRNMLGGPPGAGR